MRTLYKRKPKRLTPLEIQAVIAGGGKLPTKMEGKVIRFFGSIEPKPSSIADEVTIEDLKAAGFAAYRYEGTIDPATRNPTTVEDSTRLVHTSVPIGRHADTCNLTGYLYPVIRYELGYGWEAKLGAMRHGLRTIKELHAFMKVYQYPIPNDNS